jgi:hypothetical protein
MRKRGLSVELGLFFCVIVFNLLCGARRAPFVSADRAFHRIAIDSASVRRTAGAKGNLIAVEFAIDGCRGVGGLERARNHLKALFDR